MDKPKRRIKKLNKGNCLTNIKDSSLSPTKISKVIKFY